MLNRMLINPVYRMPGMFLFCRRLFYWVVPALLLGGAVQAEAEFLTAVEKLADAGEDSFITVIDARPARQYLQGHIPGAVNIPVAMLESRQEDHRIANQRKARSILQQAGLENAGQYVVYDDGDYRAAARVLWMLEVFGLSNVSLLNGGFKRWQDEQRPVTSRTAEISPSNFVVYLQPQYFATANHIKLAVNDVETNIIDTRKRYTTGNTIPSSVHIGVSENFTQKNIATFKPVAALQQVYASLGMEQKVILFGDNPGDVAITYVVLRHLGYDVAVHDGNWHEWVQ